MTPISGLIPVQHLDISSFEFSIQVARVNRVKDINLVGHLNSAASSTERALYLRIASSCLFRDCTKSVSHFTAIHSSNEHDGGGGLFD